MTILFKKTVGLSLLLLAGTICSNAQQPYRDLNKNGKMDDYENSKLSAEKRAADLLSQMTLSEKVGSMFHTYTMLTKDGSLDKQAFMTGGRTTDSLILNNKMTHFNLVGDSPASAIAHYTNFIQKIAESTRLGIPVTFSSDPRSSYKETDMSTTISAGDFTAFPEPLGFAATNDPGQVYKAVQVMADEYKSVGISMLLNPQADLATEPRWGRISGTFGEDAKLTSEMMKVYIKAFQGDQLNNKSIACVTKHFPGNGPQEDGWDGHFTYGRNLAYPGNNFKYHLIPFKAAIKAGTAGIMTCYGIPVGQSGELIGASFSKEIMTDLLKKKLKFKGVVISDWNVVTDKYVNGTRLIEARGWGLDNASVGEKLVALVKAGVDQIGGETETKELERLIKEGKIPMDLIDASVMKIMTLKFKLGLFDNPYVDESATSTKVGTPENKQVGITTQQKSLVLLQNKSAMYPLAKDKKIYVEGYKNKADFSAYGQIVDSIGDADFVILHLNTPFGPPRNKNLLEQHFHQGTLAFSSAESERITTILKEKPTVVIINLERAAVIPEIAQYANVIFAEFGVSNKALLPVLFGEVTPTGKLPIELPSSMEAVENQKEDVPFDSKNPLFPFGTGLK